MPTNRPNLSFAGLPAADTLPEELRAVLQTIRTELRETDVLFSLLSDSMQLMMLHEYGAFGAKPDPTAHSMTASDQRTHVAEWIGSKLFDAEQAVGAILSAK